MTCTSLEEIRANIEPHFDKESNVGGSRSFNAHGLLPA